MRSHVGKSGLPFYTSGISPDGVVFKAREINQWMFNGGYIDGYCKEWTAPMTEQMKAANEDIAEALKHYHTVVDRLKSTVQNDASSIAAVSNKTRNNLQSVTTMYGDLFKLLQSQEMVTAIANAERLAKALEVISELKSHSITLAVLDAKTTSVEPKS